MDVPFFVVIKAPHPVGCATDEEEYLLLACSLTSYIQLASTQRYRASQVPPVYN